MLLVSAKGLNTARGMGVFEDVLEGYRRIRLLILDEWLLFPLNTTEARDLLEIVERRLGVSSTIFSSQFTPEGWHSKIGEGVVADAILDRIVHIVKRHPFPRSKGTPTFPQ